MSTAIRDRLRDRFGPAVDDWCASLPTRVARLARRWRLACDDVLAGGTSCVYRCVSPAGPAILKISPDHAIARAKAIALTAWRDQRRVVRLLDADLDSAALLLERLVPGQSVAERGLAEPPIDEVTEVLSALHGVPVPDGLPRLADGLARSWPDRFERRRAASGIGTVITAPLLTEAITRAVALAEQEVQRRCHLRCRGLGPPRHHEPRRTAATNRGAGARRDTPAPRTVAELVSRGGTHGRDRQAPCRPC
ncbi:aminoglycoside phosphotransferase family protein [Tamaricihabitans halophyticus]|uniref:aminoglycoside phosphotransferase family protein n=1 Tax=Tamaricihabitans halophyticus TaxID=1262583 RepID=UPI00104592E4|nr:aminoglycoside phosphotransferase family protein [Tamaricihabitans halophyticus]